MTGFSNARQVESQGMLALANFIRERADNGQFVLVNKGPLAKHIQEAMGDLLYNRSGRLFAVEVKVEAENRHGNLFLEVWSNRNLEDRDSHAERGSNPGWMFKIRADLLFYYFLRSDELYIADVFKLKRWLFGHGEAPGALPRFAPKRQSKYQQRNDTWGICVPISLLSQQGLVTLVHPQQLSLWPEQAD